MELNEYPKEKLKTLQLLVEITLKSTMISKLDFDEKNYPNTMFWVDEIKQAIEDREFEENNNPLNY
jgi:hypothetical protein